MIFFTFCSHEQNQNISTESGVAFCSVPNTKSNLLINYDPLFVLTNPKTYVILLIKVKKNMFKKKKVKKITSNLRIFLFDSLTSTSWTPRIKKKMQNFWELLGSKKKGKIKYKVSPENLNISRRWGWVLCFSRKREGVWLLRIWSGK